MPYIKKYSRDNLDPKEWSVPVAGSAGDLNFQITRLINDYLKLNGLSYSNINECIGVLECSKLELYRRIAAPYEDKKIVENGDVYNLEESP